MLPLQDLFSHLQQTHEVFGSTTWFPLWVSIPLIEPHTQRCYSLPIPELQRLTLYKVTEMSTFSGTIHTTVPRYGFWMPGCQLWACKRQ